MTIAGAPTRPVMRSPYPYFGGKFRLAEWIIGHFPAHRIYVECNGQVQFAGCLPVIFVSLLVDHRRSLRIFARVAWALSENSWRCLLRCAALPTSCKLPISSFSLLPSLWWTPKPFGIGPLHSSHVWLASSCQRFGSAVLMKYRCSPFRLCRVRNRISPIFARISGRGPGANFPSVSRFIRHTSYGKDNTLTMSMSSLRAPYPYFGGKSSIAGTVWAVLGDTANFHRTVPRLCGCPAYTA